MSSMSNIVGEGRQAISWSGETERVVRRAANYWCSKMGVRGEDQKDVEQDVVVEAWEKVSAGKVGFKEGLWLMARNCVLDHVTKRRVPTVSMVGVEQSVNPVSLGGVVLDELADEFPDLIAIAEARAAGYEWELIADAFGVPSGTLRVQWSRMAKKARDKYGDRLGEVTRACAG